MINFHYIIDFNSLTEEQTEYIIHNIIYKYSYPCYLNVNNELTEEEKENIVKDEYEFIKNKINSYCGKEIEIIKIPRIIYDLFNIYIQIKLYMDNNNILIAKLKTYNFALYSKGYSHDSKCENRHCTYVHTDLASYCNNITEIQNNMYKYIIHINNVIYNKLKSDQYKKENDDIYKYWKYILDNIIKDIYTFHEKYITLYNKYKKEVKRQYSLLKEINSINNKESYKDDIRVELIITYKILFIYIFYLLRCDLRNEINQNLLNNVLIIDLNYDISVNKPNENNNQIVFYNVSNEELNKCVKDLNKISDDYKHGNIINDSDYYISNYQDRDKDSELSKFEYRTSIFDSLFSIYEDCLFYLYKMNDSETLGLNKIYNSEELELKTNNNKIFKKYLLISKDFKSDDHKMYFIPPIHPAFLLNCYGFSYCPRLKLNKDTEYFKIYNKKFLTKVPDYLKSPFTDEELMTKCSDKETKFIQFEKEGNKYYKKYLKYKIKYSKLINN
jgi:hypothetical protein